MECNRQIAVIFERVIALKDILSGHFS